LFYFNLAMRALLTDDGKRLPLALWLKLPADGAAEGSLLPVQLLRKYIAYARQHVFPVLSDEAKEILQVRICCSGVLQHPCSLCCRAHNIEHAAARL
jgi:hypothetical protein